MLKELFDKQKESVAHFFTSLDLEKVQGLLDFLLEREGTLFFSGVGKSGFIAKKIAFTMISTGTEAFYISPTDALHGDLGMVSCKDTFFMLSRSGESDELLHLVPAIKNKGARLIGVVCNSDSRLAAACDFLITLPLLAELCPFDMAPTTSTVAQLLFGDLLTVALMCQKGFSLEAYALNHPSGRIGKRLLLKVKDVMVKGERIPRCHPEDLLQKILVELSDKRCGCVLVVGQENELKGIFTDGDLRRALQKEGGDILQRSMHDLMNTSPVSTSSEMLAWEALKKMEGHPSKRLMNLPVVDEEKKVVGLLHLHDLVQSGI